MTAFVNDARHWVRRVVLGRVLSDALVRNEHAPQNLDRAIRECLQR